MHTRAPSVLHLVMERQGHNDDQSSIQGSLYKLMFTDIFREKNG
jgi:hypothetical protein